MKRAVQKPWSSSIAAVARMPLGHRGSRGPENKVVVLQLGKGWSMPNESSKEASA
jgi:hypothetical protein